MDLRMIYLLPNGNTHAIGLDKNPVSGMDTWLSIYIKYLKAMNVDISKTPISLPTGQMLLFKNGKWIEVQEKQNIRQDTPNVIFKRE